MIFALSGGVIAALLVRSSHAYLDVRGSGGLAWSVAGLWTERASPASNNPPASPAANEVNGQHVLPVAFEVALLQADLLGFGHSLGRCGICHAWRGDGLPITPHLHFCALRETFEKVGVLKFRPTRFVLKWLLR